MSCAYVLERDLKLTHHHLHLLGIGFPDHAALYISFYGEAALMTTCMAERVNNICGDRTEVMCPHELPPAHPPQGMIHRRAVFPQLRTFVHIVPYHGPHGGCLGDQKRHLRVPLRASHLWRREGGSVR